jgi:hypothetical protein
MRSFGFGSLSAIRSASATIVLSASLRLPSLHASMSFRRRYSRNSSVPICLLPSENGWSLDSELGPSL